MSLKRRAPPADDLTYEDLADENAKLKSKLAAAKRENKALNEKYDRLHKRTCLLEVELIENCDWTVCEACGDAMRVASTGKYGSLCNDCR